MKSFVPVTIINGVSRTKSLLFALSLLSFRESLFLSVFARFRSSDRLQWDVLIQCHTSLSFTLSGLSHNLGSRSGGQCSVQKEGSVGGNFVEHITINPPPILS
jgi:hypothetical protein